MGVVNAAATAAALAGGPVRAILLGLFNSALGARARSGAAKRRTPATIGPGRTGALRAEPGRSAALVSSLAASFSRRSASLRCFSSSRWRLSSSSCSLSTHGTVAPPMRRVSPCSSSHAATSSRSFLFIRGRSFSTAVRSFSSCRSLRAAPAPFARSLFGSRSDARISSRWLSMDSRLASSANIFAVDAARSRSRRSSPSRS
mmetsp:Transcript_36642/g.117682  ORF Transcript_36642/g.117682 Transcript_36642/m.117682 type:complete len:202 (-) Transcript_36642:1162-1767(-)